MIQSGESTSRKSPAQSGELRLTPPLACGPARGAGGRRPGRHTSPARAGGARRFFRLWSVLREKSPFRCLISGLGLPKRIDRELLERARRVPPSVGRPSA